MKTWLPRLFRFVNRLFGAAAALLLIATVAGAAAVYLGATGTSIGVVRTIALHAGHWIAGQHTDHLAIDVHVEPDGGRLEASAELTVRATQSPRRTFYFLLNPGLKISASRAVDERGHPLPARAYRLWLLTAVEFERPVPVGKPVRITLAYAGSPALEPFGSESTSMRADRVLLGPETFWYPYDAQSFFGLTAKVALPSRLTLVHNGPAPRFAVRGGTQIVRWHSERPLAGMALVAGPYTATRHFSESDEVAIRVFTAPGVGLDADRIAAAIAESHGLFREWFGDSGYSQLTAVIDAEVFRAFNDGAGLIAAPPRYFRDGDYGFHLLAHETAHVWWGGTVSERWLEPGTGGQWIVEGLATAAAALATEARFGPAGLARVRRDNLFDPDRQGVIQQMSFLDNALGIRTSRDTIYRKGGSVALVLRDVVGRDDFARGLRKLVADHRYRQASDTDVQAALETVSGLDLEEFFSEWIRSDRLPDLALEPLRDGRLEVQNRGRQPILAAVPVVAIAADGEIEVTPALVGESVPPAPASGYAVVDPDLAWADVWRENNRHPPLRAPHRVRAAGPDRLLVVAGTGRAWDPATLTLRDAAGSILHTWDCGRSPVSVPRWSHSGTNVVLAVSRKDGGEPNLVTLNTDGKRRIAGRGWAPAFDADDTIVAASEGKIVRIGEAGAAAPIVTRDGWELDAPLPSPTGRYLLYEAVRRSRLQVRVWDRDGGEDHLLLEGERERVLPIWAADESAIYAVLGAGAHWRVARVPLGDASPTTIADGITSISDLTLSPGGTQLALLAGAGYPDPRHVLHVLDLRSQTVTTLDVDGHDARSVTWIDAGEIVVATRRVPPAGEPRLPEDGALWRAAPATSTIERLD